MPAYVDRVKLGLTREFAEAAKCATFGHVGDGNVHFNLSQPVGADPAAFLVRWDELAAGVHQIAVDFGGSFSAEHGIGRLKRDLLIHAKQPLELELMRKIKDAFDPNGILNPGKLL